MTLILKNISTLLTLAGAAKKQGRRVQEGDLGISLKQAIVIEKGLIKWVGDTGRIPKDYTQKKSAKTLDMKGQTVLPGFVECHTHLVFEGDRAAEFEMRNNGVSYQEIAAKGGGILSTMKKTRAATVAQLGASARKRADSFIAQGVTTLEIKSGYALNLKDEMKMLKAAAAVDQIRTKKTFLGAHALPPEFKTYEEYLEYLQAEVLPLIRKNKLAERVDIFIEKGFFPKEAGKKYLMAAKAMGFEVLAHADQLSLSGGSDVAVEVGALSGDHLLQVSESEISRLAKSEVTCVLLPAADLYMKSKYPNARAMIEAGARVALATDFNPGSSPTQNLNLVGLLARLEMKMTLPEVIAAYTIGAAYALNLQNEVGSIEIGKSADLICTPQSWQTLFYSVGESVPSLVLAGGKKVFVRP